MGGIPNQQMDGPFGMALLIGSFISLFGYIGTIVTYLSFDELRNIPGLCLINVAVALLTSVIGMIVSRLITANGTSCIVIAIVEQLSWHAAFTWMSLLAVHMFRTFVFTSWQKPGQSRKLGARVSLTHALIGWGLPTIYTAVLVYLHFCPACFPNDVDGFYFGKGPNPNASSCWPAETVIGEHLSVDPIFILLGFNLVALLNVMIAIIRKRMATRKASGRDMRKEMAANLLILAKLSVSLGATWIPILLYRFLPYGIFPYVHVLINNWLGIILFVLLIVTSPRVRRFWREKVRGIYLTKRETSSSDLYRLKESSSTSRIDTIN